MNEPDQAQSPSPPSEPDLVWEAPAIVWEQTFIALADVSTPPCIPGQDPRCTP